MGVTIDSFLNLVYPYDYTGLIIESYEGKKGKTAYKAYGDDLTLIIKHLRENYKELLQYSLNFFLIDVFERKVTLILYTTESYSGKAQRKRFDFRTKIKGE